MLHDAVSVSGGDGGSTLMDDAQITHFDALVRAGPEAREALRACLARSPHILDERSP